jgi:hypothetical protein
MVERLSTLTQKYQDHEALIDRVRMLAVKGAYNTSGTATLERFMALYGRAPTLATKAAVLPGVTTDPAWAGAFVNAWDPIIALIARESLPVRLNFPRVPFMIPVPSQVGLGAYAWVQQGVPKPVTKFDQGTITNSHGKFSAIVALSRELMLSAPGAEGAITQALVRGAVQFADRQLLDPAITLIANARPASLTNAVVPITPVGTTVADKISELLAALFAGRPQTQRPALIVTPAVLAQLPVDRFSNVQIVASPEAGSLAIALDVAGVLYSDDGGSIDVSQDATIEMSDAPTNPPVAATVMTSLFQTNLVGHRVERMVWWQKVASNVVVTVTV